MYPSLCVLNALLDSAETAANMMRECVRGYAEKISRRAERRRGIEGIGGRRRCIYRVGYTLQYCSTLASSSSLDEIDFFSRPKGNDLRLFSSVGHLL